MSLEGFLTRNVGVAIAQQLVLLWPDGGHNVLHRAHPRYGGVLQDWQIVLRGELGAHLAPLVQKAALGEQDDPRTIARQIRLGEVARQLAQ